MSTISRLYFWGTHLRHRGKNPDQVEDRIGEDTLEDVALAVDLAGVELVEQGHHDERIEDDGEVLAGRLAVAGIDVEQSVT